MEYKKIGNEKISCLGIGLGGAENMSNAELVQTVRTAIRHGVSLFDLDPQKAASFAAFGEALSGLRKEVFLMVHFDLDYITDVRQACADPAHAMMSAAGQLQLMRVDYIDAAVIGMDSDAGHMVWDHVRELKAGGVVHHVILSGKDPGSLKQAFDPSFMDMLLADGSLYDGSGEKLAALREPADLKALHEILKDFGSAGEDKE